MEEKEAKRILITQRKGEDPIADTLPNVLEENYGITIIENDLSLEEIKQRGLRRLSSLEVDRVEAIFQYAPQIIANSVYAHSVQTSFDAAVKGSYRCILKPGVHLASSKNTFGAFRGSTLNNVNNKLAGQAEWVENSAALTASKAPQIALGIFTAMSFVTGQYFMAQINRKLTALKEGVDRIESFLDIAQRSKLKAVCQELEDLISRIEFIQASPQHISDALGQIHVIQRTARESIYFCHEIIDQELTTLGKKDKDSEIVSKLKTLGKYMSQYHVSVRIYGVATLLEVWLRGVESADEIKFYRTQICSHVSEFKDDYSLCCKKIGKYLDKNSVLNDRSLIQHLSVFGSFVVASSGKSYRKNTILPKTVDSLFEERRKGLKEKRVEMADEMIVPISDMMTLVEAPQQALESLEQLASRPVEIVKIDNEYYGNLPEM